MDQFSTFSNPIDPIQTSDDSLNLAIEYCSLASYLILDESQADRMEEILAIAQRNEVLNFLIDKIDLLLAQESGLLGKKELHHFEDQKAKLREYLESFLFMSRRNINFLSGERSGVYLDY